MDKCDIIKISMLLDDRGMRLVGGRFMNETFSQEAQVIMNERFGFGNNR